jgi:REP element-mobilizing transposase RayT
MIKDRPRRLDLIYVNPPLYFATFATRDRKRITSLDVAQTVLEQYAHRGIENFNVALGRYVIMPDHVHLFVHSGRDVTLSSWIGGLKRAMCAALLKETQATRLPPQRTAFWSPDSLITFCEPTKVTAKNGTMCGTIRCALVL